jgi:hypothetical protein
VKKILQDNSSPPSELGVLCGLAGGISESEDVSCIGKFAQAEKTFKYSSAKDARKRLEL